MIGRILLNQIRAKLEQETSSQAFDQILVDRIWKKLPIQSLLKVRWLQFCKSIFYKFLKHILVQNMINLPILVFQKQFLTFKAIWKKKMF